MKNRIALLLALTVGVSLLLAGAAVAAGPDPATPAKPGQGTLAIVTLDNEITVAFQGTGYNIHRFSSLHLAVTPGQNDFDYFCGNTKYFVGSVHVAAGQTTTVTLQPGLCEQPVVSQPKVGPTAAQLNQAYTDGFTDGLGCAEHKNSYSTDPALQAAYDSGFNAGSNITKC